jgi:hypothetical protein
MRAEVAANLPVSDASETSSLSIERLIGNRIAALAACLAYGLMERIEDGAVGSATIRRGGELVASLIKFKMTMAEFDALARSTAGK